MNSLSRMQGPPPVGTQSGFWTWNGSSWVCNADFDDSGFPGCAPPGFPPPGCPPWVPPPQGQPPWYPGANAGVSFSQTAPVNPVRGHFWWNGLSLSMFDGAAWVVVGGSQGTPVSVNPPPNPFSGQQWFNGTTLFVWDGNAWVPVSQTKSTISSTAPPNPSPGDTWWDGSQMRIWDGTQWELVGPGATVGPVPTTTIEFAIGNPGGLAAPATSIWGIIPFSATPQIDLMTGWDPVGHKYTPKRPGIYSCTLRGFGSGAAGCGRVILKNDPGTFTGAGASSDTIVGIESQSTPGWVDANGLVPLNGTTDYVRAWGWDGGGSFPAAGSNPVWIVTALP